MATGGRLPYHQRTGSARSRTPIDRQRQLYFFNSRINRVEGGAIASERIKERIRRRIVNEDARRIVTKYRESMKLAVFDEAPAVRLGRRAHGGLSWRSSFGRRDPQSGCSDQTGCPRRDGGPRQGGAPDRRRPAPGGPAGARGAAELFSWEIRFKKRPRAAGVGGAEPRGSPYPYSLPGRAAVQGVALPRFARDASVRDGLPQLPQELSELVMGALREVHVQLDRVEPYQRFAPALGGSG